MSRMWAFTVWQPWATLIVEGVKPFEFRKWPAPPAYQGQRVGIHAGARPARRSEIADVIVRLRTEDGLGTGLRPVDRALQLLERFHMDPLALPIASMLGTAVLGHPVTAAALAKPQDSDRVVHQVWGWPLTDIERCTPPIPMKGAQGFWAWNPESKP